MSSSSSSNDSDYTDRDIDDLTPARPRERAPAISAEADAPDPNFKPPSFPKTPEETERLDQIVSKSFLFNSLDRDERLKLIDAFEKKEVAPDEIIIKQGEQGDCLYIVERGSFDVYKRKGDTGIGELVNVMGPGSAVGELALMYSAPRAATVICKEPSLLWKLDRGTFTNIVKGAAIAKREKLVEILRSIPLLQKCDTQQLIQLADAAATCEVQADETVVAQGAPGDAFYILLNGSAEAVKNGVRVLRYTAGDYFGELALLNRAPRAASVKTTAQSKLIRFDVASFNRVLAPLRDTLAQKAAEYSDKAI